MASTDLLPGKRGIKFAQKKCGIRFAQKNVAPSQDQSITSSGFGFRLGRYNELMTQTKKQEKIALK